jgi:hypothetical protein
VVARTSEHGHTTGQAIPGITAPVDVRGGHALMDLRLLSDHPIGHERGPSVSALTDEMDPFRDESSCHLECMGVPIKYHHNEGGGGRWRSSSSTGPR